MTQERSSEYRGETREIAEAAYHADARVMVRMGFAPASEAWSSVQEDVLTVRYVYAPERASAVLEALAQAEAERALLRPSPAPSMTRRVLQRAARLYERQTPEMKVTLGAITGVAAGIVLWWLLGSLFLGDAPLLLFVSLFALGLAGGVLAGALGANRST